VITNAGNGVKNIASDFALARRMPISNQDQVAGSEVHDIVNADFIESQQNLGRGDPNNRHAECTDCHNPHRLMRNARFNGNGNSGQAAHDHATPHSNIASGVLRGSWGVEPVYGNGAFLSLPTSYILKRGDGGTGAGADVNSPWVTREYQVCLKCHSDFGYDDNGVYPEGSRPPLRLGGGGTPPGTNGLEQYTNQAMEFQSPLQDTGEPGGNHRSWHPVMAPTGRTNSIRGNGTAISADMFLAPWNGTGVGNQTMYCSDCHGSNTSAGTVVPTGTNPWGPHGSSNNFILKGTWDTGATSQANGLCFRCHDYTRYATEGGGRSGFCCDRDNNLHSLHAKRIDSGIKCNYCHVAVPHGWKNKAFLVNLNDVGPEAGLPPGTQVATPYSQGPYYMNAMLKIRTWKASGQWQETDCGEPGANNGKDWMRQTCQTGP
jgi:hypothetical protein